jgi:hypothetical protein
VGGHQQAAALVSSVSVSVASRVFHAAGHIVPNQVRVIVDSIRPRYICTNHHKKSPMGLGGGTAWPE